jgi:hypothetical protein
MIALCLDHHAKADAGAYTKQQLREFKKYASKNSSLRKGSFDWIRQDLLAVVGGNFYYETPIIFQFKGHPVIWFNRDEDRRLLLNIRMLSKLPEPRLIVEDNYWMNVGKPIDLECPPSGKFLRVSYENGDAISIEFINLISSEDTLNRYQNSFLNVKYPITAIEINNAVAGTNINFGPRETEMPGHNIISNGFFSHSRVGIAVE